MRVPAGPKAGQIDVIYAQPGDYRAEVLEGGPGSVKEMVDQGKAVVKPWEAFAYSYFGWNLRLPQFREKEVRVALAHLFPKDRIIETVYFGLAAPINGPIHPWQTSCVPELGHIPFDPAKAASILDAAGWKMGPRNVREKVVDGKPVELRFKVIYPNTRATARDATLLYQKSAAEVGVLIEPEGIDRLRRAEVRGLDADRRAGAELGADIPGAAHARGVTQSLGGEVLDTTAAADAHAPFGQQVALFRGRHRRGE